MKEIKSFEQLEVWQAGMELVQEVYGLSDSFPEIEQSVLLRQMRTTAIKIPAKIGAGYSCKRGGMMFRFYAYGLAMIGMLQTHIELAVRFRYIPEVEAKPVFEKCKSIERMLEKMILHED